jgi:nucleoside-diphosphate-sugar epimerase
VEYTALAKRLAGLKFTAVLTDGYETTVATLNTLRDHGISMPHGVSFVGYDDIELADHLATPITVVRHANVYGPGDEHWDRIVPQTINCILQGYQPVLRGDGQSTRDYIFVSEIIDAYLKLAELEHEGLLAVNLGGFNYSTSEVVSTILDIMKSNVAPKMEDYLPGELLHQHIDNSGAKELIGWEPKIDLVEGLWLTIPWYGKKIVNG